MYEKESDNNGSGKWVITNYIVYFT
jgi:hypothetical protein